MGSSEGSRGTSSAGGISSKQLGQQAMAFSQLLPPPPHTPVVVHLFVPIATHPGAGLKVQQPGAGLEAQQHETGQEAQQSVTTLPGPLSDATLPAQQPVKAMAAQQSMATLPRPQSEASNPSVHQPRAGLPGSQSGAALATHAQLQAPTAQAVQALTVEALQALDRGVTEVVVIAAGAAGAAGALDRVQQGVRAVPKTGVQRGGLLAAGSGGAGGPDW